MRTPIVIACDNGDLWFFRKPRDVEGDIEAIDVKNGEYVAYDSEGRLLELRGDASEHRGPFGWWTTVDNGGVEVLDGEQEPGHADELKRLLMAYLDRDSERRNDLASRSLERLLLDAINWSGFSP